MAAPARLVPGKGRFPDTRQAAAGPAWRQPQPGWPKPSADTARGQGAPKTRVGSLLHCPQRLPQRCGGPADRAGGVQAPGPVPIASGTKSPCPKAHHEGKDCLAQHPAVPPCHRAPRPPWHRMGVFKPEQVGTRVFTVSTRVPLQGHGCECTPKQTHLYEYCIVYIIFFTQMTVLTRCQENNIGSQRFYQLL